MLLHRQQGFSLIETMVAAAILSFSLLSFAQAELLALHISEQAYLINLADLKNIELAENFTVCESHALCLQKALSLWKKEIQESFPKGIGEISTLNFSNYQSKIHCFFRISKFPSFLSLLFSV